MINDRMWKSYEFKKILKFISNGNSLEVELEKDAIYGTLKIGDEEISVYVGRIEAAYAIDENYPIHIKKKFTLIEI